MFRYRPIYYLLSSLPGLLKTNYWGTISLISLLLVTFLCIITEPQESIKNVTVKQQTQEQVIYK